MSAARPGALRRLWRRAPAWRGALLLLGVSIVLLALYARSPAPAVALETSSYKPLSATDVLGPPFQFLVHVAGRAIPLPRGDWHIVLHSERKGDPPVAGLSLARVEGNQVTGEITVLGTTTPATSSKHFEGGECDRPSAFLAERIPSFDPALHECWGIAPQAGPAAVLNQASTYAHLQARLRDGGIDLPSSLVSAGWSRFDDREGIAVDYMFPPKPAEAGNQPAFTARLQRWADGWTKLVEAGAQGKLEAAAVQQAVVSGTP